MKKIFILCLFLFSLFFQSCNDEDTVEPDQTGNSYRLKSAITYESNVKSTRIDYFYNDAKLIKTEQYVFVPSTSEWILVYKSDITYDGTTVNIITNIPSKSSTQFKSVIQIVSGKLHEIKDYTIIDHISQLNASLNWYYTNDKIDSCINHNYSNGMITTSAKDVFEFENDHLIKDDFYLMLENSYWYLNYRYTFEYTDNTFNLYGAHFLNNEFQISWKEINHLSGDLIIKKESQMYRPDSGWETSSEENYSYNDNNMLSEYHLNTPSENAKIIYEYESGEGNLNWFTPDNEQLKGEVYPNKSKTMLNNLFTYRR